MADEVEVVRRGVLKLARQSADAQQSLPGEFELADRLFTTRPQIRRVLALLEQQGIVRRQQGAPTTVDPLALRMTIRLEEQVEHSDLLSRLGYEPSVEVLESGRTTFSAAILTNLTPGGATGGLRAVKLWRADGVPAMLAENYLVLPDAYAGEVDPEASIFATAEAIWGEPIIWDVATPGVENLGDVAAARLELEPGRACLTMEILGVTRSGRRVFYAFERHHPEIVKYSLVRSLPSPF